MGTPLRVTQLARAFWKEAGEEEPFPRSLRRAIAWAVPLTVMFLPRLGVKSVGARLRELGVACSIDETDRPLRACLVARRGQGIAFVDGADSENEQRYSLAHELAHYLRDYRYPREEACKRLGDQVQEVLDGERPPTLQERLDALLRNTPVGFHVHLMHRKKGQIASGAVAVAEREADLLAYELLAPAQLVTAKARRGGLRRTDLHRLLEADFGLPSEQARAYSDILVPEEKAGDPLLRRIGLLP